MTARNRLKDMLPVLVVFFVVSVVGTILVIEYVLHDPVDASSAPAHAADGDVPQPYVPR